MATYASDAPEARTAAVTQWPGFRRLRLSAALNPLSTGRAHYLHNGRARRFKSALLATSVRLVEEGAALPVAGG
jgi:hypothetical protein